MDTTSDATGTVTSDSTGGVDSDDEGSIDSYSSQLSDIGLMPEAISHIVAGTQPPPSDPTNISTTPPRPSLISLGYLNLTYSQVDLFADLIRANRLNDRASRQSVYDELRDMVRLLSMVLF